MHKNKYSYELRIKVLKEYDNGVEVPVLSKKYNIPKPTIYSWIRKYKNSNYNIVKNCTIKEKGNSATISEILIVNKQLKDKELEIVNLKSENENYKNFIIELLNGNKK